MRAYSILTGVIAGGGNLFGPFCFVRDDCVVGNDCILGAHVETTRSQFGNQVEISHRAFVGDAIIGDNVIIGAGVVFCNFDGQERQPTRVGSGVTIGSGSLLVPPVTIGDGVLIGPDDREKICGGHEADPKKDANAVVPDLTAQSGSYKRAIG